MKEETGIEREPDKSMKKGLKKKDLILIIVILVIAAGAYVMHYFLRDSSTGVLTVKVNGALQGTYDLDKNQEIRINNGTNLLQIKDGKAKMIEADCPDQLCVHQKAISANRENIICLPNKVIVEVTSKKSSEIDAMTN